MSQSSVRLVRHRAYSKHRRHAEISTVESSTEDLDVSSRELHVESDIQAPAVKIASG